jgi:uncharacterized protein
LLYAGLKYGAKIEAYYVKTPFQPDFELQDVHRLANELGTKITVINKNILEDELIASNPPNRCYLCKMVIFKMIRELAFSDRFPLIIDGTNATDNADSRPGMKALAELSVRSPLRECGITKDEVRKLSKEAGLSTWNKPAYSCLATRVPFGRTLTEKMLREMEET